MNIVNDYEYFILKKLQETIDRAYDKVVESECSEEAWEALYHFVFSDRVSHKICEILPSFDWFDPDTTYEEDVMAWIMAFYGLIRDLKIV